MASVQAGRGHCSARGAVATAAMVLFQMASAAAVVLVEKGKPNAVIILGADAPESVQYAAAELQTYVEKVTGARLPIQKEPLPQDLPGAKVLLGEGALTKELGLGLDGLPSDGFRVVSRDNWVAILGRDYRGPPVFGLMNPWQYHEVYSEPLKVGAFGETGTLYGVYRFLEDYCGVRWYMPGELGTVTPTRDGLRVDAVDRQTAPDFGYRYPWFCNFAQPQAAQDALWYRRAGFGAAYPVQIMHSFEFMLKYKESHPEYFALIDGKRDFTNLSCIGGGGNLCLSNPALATQWVAEIKDYFDKNPQQSVFPLMPSDGMTKICECALCQAQIDVTAARGGKFSNYVWTFIDTVAKEVEKTHPGKIIGCCSYESYAVPPTRPAKLNPNVAVMITKTRGSYNDKEYQERANRIVTGWREKASRVYTWDYYIWYSWPPWRGLPIIFPHIISDDLRFLKGATQGEFLQAGSWEEGVEPGAKIDFPGMQHLNLYVTGKLLWDASQDVDQLLAEYYTVFYGPAAVEMKDFWTKAEEIWMTACPPAAGRKTDWRAPVNIYTKERLDQLSACLERAQQQAPENSVYRQRVDLIKAELLPARRKLTNVLVLNPPRITVPGPAAPVRVDGILDDAVWAKTPPLPFVDTGGEEAAHRTLAYAAWDNDALYLAFINYETEIPKLTALATQRDQSFAPAVWDDDGMEIFISPDPEARSKCYQFIVSAKGVVWDGLHNGTGLADDKWNSGCEAAARLEENRWLVEVRIPFKDLGLAAPPAGKQVAANLYRNRHCGQQVVYSCWSPTVDSAHYTPARFGLLTFGP